MASGQTHGHRREDAEHVSEKTELYFILVGKSGGGKSATGNTILGEEKFESKLSLQPVTLNFCGQRRAKEWQGMRVVVVDSPAAFNAKVKDWQNVHKIRKCLSEASPGLHALVFVTQVGNFTQEDQVALQRVEEIFGPEATRHMVLLFTRKEDLEGQSLEGYIKESGNRALQGLAQKCGHRCCAFNNKASREERDAQVEDLLSQIAKVTWREWGDLLQEEPSRQPPGSAAAGETVDTAMHVDELSRRQDIKQDRQVKAPGAKGSPFKCLRGFGIKKGNNKGERKSEQRSPQTGGKFFSGFRQGRKGRAAGGSPGEGGQNPSADSPPNWPAASSPPGRSPQEAEGPIWQSPGQPNREADFISSLSESDLRIVLVGKSGGGKSATGNTILGEDKFESKLQLKSATQTLCAEFWAKEWQGRRVLVVDTPAVFDAKGIAPPKADEIRKNLSLASRGPHVLVFVTQVGRFTQEDQVALQRVEEIFGQEATRHMVLLFTRKEDLEGQSLEGYIKESGNRALQGLAQKCGGRCCAFNNKASREERDAQVEDLLCQMEKMMQKEREKTLCEEPPRQPEGAAAAGEQEEMEMEKSQESSSFCGFETHQVPEEPAEEGDEDFEIISVPGDQEAAPQTSPNRSELPDGEENLQLRGGPLESRTPGFVGEEGTASPNPRNVVLQGP